MTRAGEMAQRLILGEVLVSATLQDSQLHEAKESGAPLAFAEEVSPVVSPEYHVGVLKNSAHPNVGHFMVAFMAYAKSSRCGKNIPVTPPRTCRERRLTNSCKASK